MTNLSLMPDPNNQFSAFLLDHLSPTIMRQNWDIALKVNHYIKPLIQTIKFIMDLGELEHSHDWDPFIKIGLFDGDSPDNIKYIETQPGYYIMDILNYTLLIEDEVDQGDQNDGDISYHTIPIKDIHSIQLLRS